MAVDFIHNGRVTGVFGGSSDPAARLLQSNFDPSVLRPWESTRDGRVYVTVNSGRKDKDGNPVYVNRLVHNAPATLRKDEWIRLDDYIARAARTRLRVWEDVRAASPRDIPNAMGTPIIQHQTMTDAGVAVVSMDGLREGPADRPIFDLVNLPLPIIHSDFFFTLREVAVSRNMGGGLDVTMGEQAARRVAEEVEKLILGSSSSYSYGGGTVFGLTNFTGRLTFTPMIPTNPAWTGGQLVTDLLGAIQALQTNYFFGPYVLYFSKGWTRYLNADYTDAYAGGTTLRRIEQIEGVSAVRTMDYIADFQIVIVQMTSDVIQAIEGMDITALNWESHGGMRLNFKVLCIKVPRLLANASGNSGISHGTAA